MIDKRQRNDEHNNHQPHNTHASIQPPPPPRVLKPYVVFNIHLLLHLRLHIWRRYPAHLPRVQNWFRGQWQTERRNKPAERKHEAEYEAEDLGVAPIEERLAVLVHGWRVPAIPKAGCAGVGVEMG
jgi:hypothetical protein